ncbi:MAG: enoyl-CoA hydratase-related protein [Acidimicrobiales bacterium]
MSNVVHLERNDDNVAVIRLDNPKVNALSSAVLDGVRLAALELAADPPGAVVLTGGERIFAAGADISEFAGPDEARTIGALFVETTLALESIPRMVIAAVAGFALGGGCELALACDLRVAADNAAFGQPEILLGIIPGGGGTQRLTRLVGPSRAKEIILSGRMVKADEALRIGLADAVVPLAELTEHAMKMAAGYARGALVAQALAKRAIQAGLDSSLADGLALEQRLFAEVFATEDARIGIESFKQHGPGKAKFVGK